jgi:hypothetical protein
MKSTAMILKKAALFCFAFLMVLVFLSIALAFVLGRLFRVITHLVSLCAGRYLRFNQH